MEERFKEPYSSPKWWWEGNYTPLCFDCSCFRGASKGKIRCTIYPNGIPEEVVKCINVDRETAPVEQCKQFKLYKKE